MTNLDSVLKIRDIAYKGPYSQSYSFSTSHVWMWMLEHKEGWVPKNWCFWTVVLEKTLESSLDCRRSNQSILKETALNIHWRDQCWGWGSNTLATWCKELIGKDPGAGKDWRQEKGMTEDKMVGWYHWFNGLEFEQALENGEDRETWHAAVLGVAKSWTWLSNWSDLIMWYINKLIRFITY